MLKSLNLKINEKLSLFRSLFDHFSIALITSHRIKKNVGSELANAFNQEMRDVSSNPGHLAHSIKDLYSNHPVLEESCKTEADTQSIRIIASSD